MRWWRADELGEQAWRAGKARAVRCRLCGTRYELAAHVEPGERCETCGNEGRR